MGKYILSKKAKEDIADIWNYTYETWSEEQADKYFLLLHEGFELISINPKIGLVKREVDNYLYEFTIHKHMVFYRILGDVEIRIVRVFHERMDMNQQLSK
jgi:toxin ParE1/3/4